MSARDIILSCFSKASGKSSVPSDKISNINCATITNDAFESPQISKLNVETLFVEGDKIAISIYQLYRTLYGKVRANRAAIISFVVMVRELFISMRLGLQARWTLREGMRRGTYSWSWALHKGATSFNEFRAGKES